ncbi:MAG TPA: hypothetical protein VNQ76_18275 [Planctomicrobium sp.]|nr:hypothetical protein [Planctomicrobium sp.]
MNGHCRKPVGIYAGHGLWRIESPGEQRVTTSLSVKGSSAYRKLPHDFKDAVDPDHGFPRRNKSGEQR